MSLTIPIVTTREAWSTTPRRVNETLRIFLCLILFVFLCLFLVIGFQGFRAGERSRGRRGRDRGRPGRGSATTPPAAESETSRHCWDGSRPRLSRHVPG